MYSDTNDTETVSSVNENKSNPRSDERKMNVIDG